MNRIRLIALVLLVVVCAATPASAQDDSPVWSALVYSTSLHQLVRVGVDGELASYDLEFGADGVLQGRHIVVWPDGQQIAYCVVYNNGVDAATLYVRDLASGAVLAETAFADAADCRVTQPSLSADGERLAVALFNYFPGQPDADTRVPPWQLAVVEVDSGDVVQVLDGDDAVAQTDIDADSAIIPEARAFAGETVTWFAIPYAVGASNSYAVYDWHLDSGALTPVEGPGIYDVASLPETGEQVYATQDETLPFAVPEGPIPANNVVMVDDGDAAPYIINHNPTWITIDTAFIDNGQQVALVQVPAADQPQTTAFSVSIRAIALDRQGETDDLLSNNGALTVLGAPSGYIALMGPPSPDGPYRLLYGMGGQTTTLWQATGQSWELVWAAPTPTAPGLSPFTRWTP